MDGDMSRYIYQYHTQMNLVGGDVAVWRHAASWLLVGCHAPDLAMATATGLGKRQTGDSGDSGNSVL